MACDRARWESYGNFTHTLYYLFLSGLLLLLVAFLFPRDHYVLVFLLFCYTDTEWHHDRFNTTPNTQSPSLLFVVNFLYYIIPGRGNKALKCNPDVRDEKSFILRKEEKLATALVSSYPVGEQFVALFPIY